MKPLFPHPQSHSPASATPDSHYHEAAVYSCCQHPFFTLHAYIPKAMVLFSIFIVTFIILYSSFCSLLFFTQHLSLLIHIHPSCSFWGLNIILLSEYTKFINFPIVDIFQFFTITNNAIMTIPFLSHYLHCVFKTSFRI